MFIPIPGFGDYLIDKTGAVFCWNTGKIAYGYVASNGYRMIRVTDNHTQSVIVGIHRLLALAFIPIPSNIETPLPNHKDGNKENNLLSNLEWTTYSGNITHAYQTGLRTDNRHILIMNEKTRNITSFYSLGECGRFFGVDAGAIHWQINSRKEPKTYREYFLKYADDLTSWPESGLSYKKQPVDGTNVLLTNCETGEVEYYRSMKSAAERIGCKGQSIHFQLCKPSPTPYRGFLVRYGDLSGSFK